MHRVRRALSQVKIPIRDAVRQRNPQHFHRSRTGSMPLRTSHPHVCAQPAGTRSSSRAGHAAGQRARDCVTTVGTPDREAPRPGPDEIAHEGGPRMPATLRLGGRRGGSRAYRLRSRRGRPGPRRFRPRSRSSRLAFRRLRRAGPGKRPGRAESGKTPPCMRWRGPARPRRTGWSVAWPAGIARRPPGPGTRVRTGRPAFPTFPGSPSGGTRFQR